MPENTTFLSGEERALALKRLVLDAGESDANEGGALNGLKLALTDVKVWALTFLLTAAVIAVSFNAFFPTIVSHDCLGEETTTSRFADSFSPLR